MTVIKLLLSFMAGSLISIVFLSVAGWMVGLPTHLVRSELIVGMAVVSGGVLAYFFSFGFMVCCLSGLLGAWVLTYLVILLNWPEMNYEKALGYLFIAGLVGVLAAGMAARRKLRTHRRAQI